MAKKNQNKTLPNQLSVKDFLEKIEHPQKRQDCFEILGIMQRITAEPPVMWGTSIVGFGTYHYKYESGREGDMLKIGFSPRKQNLTMYIMPGFSRYDELMSKLGQYKTGKSCLYIKKLDDVDKRVLEELFIEAYKYMSEKYD